MLDLHRLRLLRELKHRGTLTAVAEALSYSPSTISQQLSLLEREVGVSLLEPEGRRLRLTPQAEILVAHTEDVLRQLAAAESDIARSMTELTGTVRVSTFQTANLALIPIMLTVLGRAHPRLRVEVVQLDSETALPAMVAHDLDLVIGEDYPGHPVARRADVERFELGGDPVRLALPPGVGAAAGLAGLADRAWVMEPLGCASRHWSVEVCRGAGFEPDVRYQTSDILVHLQLVEQGHAVALLPDLVWFDRRPTVTLCPPPGERHIRTLYLATRLGGGAHPAIIACRDALQRALRQIGDQHTLPADPGRPGEPGG